MKVKYIGFGGGYIEYPCYEDENGKLYFDLNDGRNGLSLYTGAYRHPEDHDIIGEPYSEVAEEVECDEPFQRHLREFDYMMLGRWKSDCDYFLGYGRRYEGHLYFKSVSEHIAKMKEMWNSFSDEDKPQWLTMEMIEQYEKAMMFNMDKFKNELLSINGVTEVKWEPDPFENINKPNRPIILAIKCSDEQKSEILEVLNNNGLTINTTEEPDDYLCFVVNI